jgi:hypothetical protein
MKSESKTVIENLLFKKAGKLMEAVRIQEAARFFEDVLSEADPLPRVEKDIDGKPVIPTRDQFVQYFQDMQGHHIQQHMNASKDRWETAAKEARDKADAYAKAQHQAHGTEQAVAKEVLGQKT